MKVYKFKSNIGKIDCNLDLLSQNKFFAATFETLNDPFEANFDELITESMQKIESIFGISTQEIIDSVNKIINCKHKLGIFSLSRNISNDLMWAHYANSHFGYCIEYDFEKINESSQNYDLSFKIDVLYNDILQTLTIDDISDDRFIVKMFGTKKNAMGV